MFLGRLFTPSYLPPPHPQPFIVKSLSSHSLPTSYPGWKRRPPGRHPHPPPANLRHLSLIPAPRTCGCRRSCASAPLTLPTSDCTQIPVGPWGGGRLSWVLPRLCVPASPSPRSSTNISIVRYLVSLSVDFCENARGQGASTLWKSRALVLSTPATWTCRCCSGYPPLPPLVFIIPSLSVE